MKRIENRLPVWVEDRVDAMRYGKHLAFFELGPNGGLNQSVRLVVNRSGRLVEHENSRTTQQRSRQTEQLPLPHRQVPAALRHFVLESQLRACTECWILIALHSLTDEKGLEMNLIQCSPNFLVAVSTNWIQVETQCAWNEKYYFLMYF